MTCIPHEIANIWFSRVFIVACISLAAGIKAYFNGSGSYCENKLTEKQRIKTVVHNYYYPFDIMSLSIPPLNPLGISRDIQQCYSTMRRRVLLLIVGFQIFTVNSENAM